MADIEKIERELRDGLHGVTPGEWELGSGWVFVDPKNGYQTSPLRHIIRDVPGDERQIADTSSPHNPRTSAPFWMNWTV